MNDTHTILPQLYNTNKGPPMRLPDIFDITRLILTNRPA